MKTIKIIIVFIGFNIALNAQCFDFYVQTPNNGNIKACSSGGYSDWQVQQADAYSRTFAIQVFESGTNSYNCHGYAWHFKEGGNKVWINNMTSEIYNLNTYWEDISYTEISCQLNIDNLKVFYGSTYASNDHSAITTSDPNIFISKMGCGCLVSHYKNSTPYDGSSLRYFIKTPIISGPTIVCSSGASFTINNLPSVDSIIWIPGPNVSISSGQNTSSCTFYSTNNNSSWVSVRLVYRS